MKPLLTSRELISHMSQKGITFKYCSKDDAKSFLENSNYYLKLASYRSNYRKYSSGPNSGKYIDLDFSYLRELSKIDMHLRYISLQMVLDIEHYLKVRLLNDIENNPFEDGYHIVEKFLAIDYSSRTLSRIKSLRSSAYCKDLIYKYYPSFPAWVFVEVISFSDLSHFCETYNKTYNTKISDRILLNSVRDIRNACAHSNCLINNLLPGNNTPHHSVVKRVKSIFSIGENSRDKKLSNKCIYDFICLIFAYNEIILDDDKKQMRFYELKNLFDKRMAKHKDWFSSNSVIMSSYYFVKKVLDSMLA